MKKAPKKAAAPSENEQARYKITRNDVAFQAILSRREFFKTLIDPRRDIDKECGYPSNPTLDMYKDQYERGGIATRIVDLYPEECWKGQPEIIENDDPEDTEFETQIQDLVERFNLWFHLRQVDKISGIGRFGIILLGIADNLTLDQPVAGLDDSGTFNPGQEVELSYIRTFDETVVTVNTIDENPKSPRYGQPLSYNINFADSNDGSSTAATSTFMKKVHWSRVIHVAEDCRNSIIYGTPRMKKVFDRIYDLKKVLGGAGEGFWKGATPGYSFELQPDVTNYSLDIDTVKQQMFDFSNGLQRYLALEGLTTKSLAPTVSSPQGHFDVILMAICISMGVPMRVFTGSEQAQLASSQDKKTWNDRLAGRQKLYLSPMVIYPFIDRLINIGIVTTPSEWEENKKRGYKAVWEDLNAPSDQDKATVAGIITTALASYVSAGLDTLIEPVKYFTLVQGWSDEQAEAIVKATKEHIDESLDDNPDEEQPIEEDAQPQPGNAPKPQHVQIKIPVSAMPNDGKQKAAK